MFNGDGDHEAAHEEHAGGLHVVHADLCGGHDAEEREQNHGDEGGGGDGEELPQPVAAHQNQDVETFGHRGLPQQGQGEQQNWNEKC